MSSERAPTPDEVIRRHIGGSLDETHTALPVVVTAYDAALQKASVKPLVKHPFYDEAQNRKLEILGVVSNVPVKFLSAGGFAFTVPISDGSLVIDGETMPATTGVLITSELSLDRWLSGTGQEVDPEIDHRFNLSDGFFLPGVNPFGAPLPGVPTDHAFAGRAGGLGAHFKKDVVIVAADPADAALQFVALAQKVLDELNHIKTQLDSVASVTHTHSYSWTNTPGSSVTGASAIGYSDTYAPGSVAATKLKTK